MKENGRENQEPEIISEWRTKEINPQEIAEALRGVLEKTPDNDSWNIHLHYGEDNPLLTIKGNNKSRIMAIVVNARLGPDNPYKYPYRCSVEFSNIEELSFIRYFSPVSNRVETDIAVNIRDSGRDLSAGGMIISSYAHQAEI